MCPNFHPTGRVSELHNVFRTMLFLCFSMDMWLTYHFMFSSLRGKEGQVFCAHFKSCCSLASPLNVVLMLLDSEIGYLLELISMARQLMMRVD